MQPLPKCPKGHSQSEEKVNGQTVLVCYRCRAASIQKTLKAEGKRKRKQANSESSRNLKVTTPVKAVHKDDTSKSLIKRLRKIHTPSSLTLGELLAKLQNEDGKLFNLPVGPLSILSQACRFLFGEDAGADDVGNVITRFCEQTCKERDGFLELPAEKASALIHQWILRLSNPSVYENNRGAEQELLSIDSPTLCD